MLDGHLGLHRQCRCNCATTSDATVVRPFPVTTANPDGRRQGRRSLLRTHPRSGISHDPSGPVITAAAGCHPVHRWTSCLQNLHAVEGDGAFRHPHETRSENPVQVPSHPRHINSLHSRFKSFLRPFRGPASRHLPGYIDWFIARVARLDPSAAILSGK